MKNPVKVFVFVTLLLGSCFDLVYAQNFGWAKRMTGSYLDEHSDIAIDKKGNVYTTGSFRKTRDFDPGVSDYSLTSMTSDYPDIFVSKLNADGNFMWAKKMGGVKYDIGNSVEVDADGNVYISGDYDDSVDFDPGPGVFNLTGGGIFVVKLDSSGDFVWAKKAGSVNGFGLTMAVDEEGSSYCAGWYMGLCDFDPGPGTFYFEEHWSNAAVFISKLDKDGNFVWAKKYEGIRTIARSGAKSIVFDGLGSLYLTGQFTDSVDFDPGVGRYVMGAGDTSSAFISRIDTSGNFIWAKKLGSVSYGQIIRYDGLGNVYIGGVFRGTVDFDPGPDSNMLTSKWVANQNYGDNFILKLDTGGYFGWAKRIIGNEAKSLFAISNDVLGNTYMCGRFRGTADFDPDGAGYPLTSFTSAAGGVSLDIFVTKHSSTGTLLWAKQLGGYYEDGDYGIVMAFNRSNEGLFISGNFEFSADFDPGPKAAMLNGSGVFVCKTQCKSSFDSTFIGCYGYTLNGDTLPPIRIDTQILTNIYGCDSVVTIKKRLYPMNLNISQHGDTLIPDIKEAAYFQWINCSDGKAIVGANKWWFVPTFSGSFKVEIQRILPVNCLDTSACYTVLLSTGINKSVKEKSIQIFPNPNNGHFKLISQNIEPGSSFVITNSTGQQIASHSLDSGKTFEWNHSLVPGLYFIQVVDGSGVVVLNDKIVVVFGE